MAIERVRIKSVIDTKPRPRPRIRIRKPRPEIAGLTLLDAISDPHLFRPFFKDRSSWEAWFAFIAAAFALDMDAEALDIFRKCTGRTDPPVDVAREVYLVVGRRGGKSRILALIAVWLATFIDHSACLAPGEIGVVQVLAADRRQAKVILRYVKAFLAQVPLLARIIVGETQDGVSLSNNINIETTTASFRSVRGRTVVAALLDELAFWQSEDSANPDTEVLAAIRPSMATVPNAMLLCASSPYARRGVLFNAHKQHFGKDGSTLVWQADTLTMNPAIDRAVIDQAYHDDPVAASAEYGAQFRSDIESFVSREAIEACISPGIFERAPVADVRYSVFVDPSGGSGKDSFALAIAHAEDDIAVLDCVREYRPPFSPEAVVEEVAALLKAYGINYGISDRFAGQWVREPFEKRGITIDPAARPKSDLYRDALPQINSRKVDLLDHQKMLTQFLNLERRTARSGRDAIAEPPNSHDDICNVVAGVIVNLRTSQFRYDCELNWISNGDGPRDFSGHRTHRLHQHIFGGGFR
jgi:hypothetical protein